MKQYLLTYVGGTEEKFKKAEQEGQGEGWNAWISDLGDAIINPGTPLRPSKTVTPEGVKDTPMNERLNGYSIVAAENLDAACEIASRCPFLAIGRLEVAEITQRG